VAAASASGLDKSEAFGASAAHLALARTVFGNAGQILALTSQLLGDIEGAVANGNDEPAGPCFVKLAP
jgi:hypothetical protein